MGKRRGSRRVLASRVGRSTRALVVLLLIGPELHQQRSSGRGVAFLLPPSNPSGAARVGHHKPHLIPVLPHASSSSLLRRDHPFLHRTDCSAFSTGGARVGAPRGGRARGVAPTSLRALPQPALHASNADVLFASQAASAKPALAALADAMRLVAKTLYPVLVYLWLTLVRVIRALSPSVMEVKLGLRLAVAAAVGMAIGLERRTSHRPAGVRTMSLVAMGACTFTLVSQFGFSKADQARVAASVASGVGFIGAGVITTSAKESLRGRQSANDVDGDVRGLTTASAIWITAGLGMACGAGLFFTATLGAVLTVAILKISRVQQSLQSKWYRLRAIVRPRLAQKAAAAADAAAAAAAAAAEDEEAKESGNNGDNDGDEGGSASGGKDKDREEKEAAKSDREKAAPKEAEESADAIYAEIAASRAEFRAKATEAFRRAISPDDDTPIPPPEKRKAVGVQRGEDSDDSDDYDGGEIVKDDIYDPFFGDSWPGSPPEAGDKATTPPPPIRKSRTKSRVIPSRARREHLSTRGMYVVSRPTGPPIRPPAVRHTAADVSAPEGGGPVPGSHVRHAGDLADPKEQSRHQQHQLHSLPGTPRHTTLAAVPGPSSPGSPRHTAGAAAPGPQQSPGAPSHATGAAVPGPPSRHATGAAAPGPTPPGAPRHATVVAAAPAPEGVHRRRQGSGGGDGGGGGGGGGHSENGAEVAHGGGGAEVAQGGTGGEGLGVAPHVTLADSVVPDGDVVNGGGGGGVESGVDGGALKPVTPARLNPNARGKLTDS